MLNPARVVFRILRHHSILDPRDQALNISSSSEDRMDSIW